LPRVAAKTELSNDVREVIGRALRGLSAMAASISLTRYLVEQQRANGLIPVRAAPAARSGGACLRSASAMRSTKARWAACWAVAELRTCRARSQKKLDIIANEVLIEANEWGGHLAAMASSEMDSIYMRAQPLPARRIPAAVRPLDGSQQHRRERQHRHDLHRAASSPRAERRDGVRLLAGRCARRSPQATACTGRRPLWCSPWRRRGHVARSTASKAPWSLTQEHVRIPDDTQEFAINMSNMRHWAPPVQRYIDECLARQRRPARQGLQHALGWPAWWPMCTAS
jgi:fructose-1,6-bisphosphatase I